jgi:hypothetical protein
LKGIPADTDASTEEDDADKKGSQNLHTSMTVWMVSVGGFDRNDHAEQHDGRSQHVSQNPTPVATTDVDPASRPTAMFTVASTALARIPATATRLPLCIARCGCIPAHYPRLRACG